MAEVIVLSDSSAASSDCEMASASSSTTPAASPAVPRRPAQSVGYSNAVEAALAMAAAFETSDKAKKKTKKKNEIKPPRMDVPCTALIHPTSYRGIYLDVAPSNILRVQCVPFDTRSDHPLTYYDETDTLATQCAILESFGKPTQCISSVFPSEVKPQSDVTRAVSALVAAHLPVIRSCHRRKVQVILVEARQEISAYRAALEKHKRLLFLQNVTSHVLPRTATEKHAIGRGDGFVREKTVSALIQLNRVEKIQPLRRYTTSIGVRANYRVEDDPILRYTAITRPSNGSGGDDAAKKYALRIGNAADEEVIEYVLRLVVGRLGDSEQVFQALKTELDFSQAYTAYCELKKLHDSRLRAQARIDQIEKLSRDGAQSSDPDVASIVKLMEQASLSKKKRAKVLSRRLQPPIRNLESSFVDNLVSGATTGTLATSTAVITRYQRGVLIQCILAFSLQNVLHHDVYVVTLGSTRWICLRMKWFA
ncbi:cleavage induced predicted protein [Phytophthora cinnamomi]|uniref:cleavage induced predicted protein n=2 Tax=Phytophthora cinnamomi TaxID=4785 RepID=UPI00355A290F|nr:cleavage induced predicted protein [Phytophthora cinnamomi]